MQFFRAEHLVFDEDLHDAAALVDTIMGLFPWRRGILWRAGVARLSYFLNGLFSLCDWLGSSEAFAYLDTAMEPADYWDTHTLPNAEKVLDEIQPALFRRLVPRPPAPSPPSSPIWPKTANRRGRRRFKPSWTRCSPPKGCRPARCWRSSRA